MSQTMACLNLACLSFGMVFFGVTSLFLCTGPEFSSSIKRLSNQFVKLMDVEVSGLSRKSGFIDFEDFYWVFPFSRYVII